MRTSENSSSPTLVNRGMKEGRGVIGPGPRLFLRQYWVPALSFLALLLLSASSQEVVRDPPYRTRDPAYGIPYRIRHSAYRSRRGSFFKHLYHLNVWFVADPRATHRLPQVLRAEKLACVLLCIELLHHQHVGVLALDSKESVALPAPGTLVLGRLVVDLLPLGVVFDPMSHVYPGHRPSSFP